MKKSSRKPYRDWTEKDEQLAWRIFYKLFPTWKGVRSTYPNKEAGKNVSIDRDEIIALIRKRIKETYI